MSTANRPNPLRPSTSTSTSNLLNTSMGAAAKCGTTGKSRFSTDASTDKKPISSRPLFVVSKPGANSSRVSITAPVKPVATSNSSVRRESTGRVSAPSAASKHKETHPRSEPGGADKENESDVQALLEAAYRRGLQDGRHEAESIVNTTENSNTSMSKSSTQASLHGLLDDADMTQNISHLPLSPVRPEREESSETISETGDSTANVLSLLSPRTPVRTPKARSKLADDDDDDACFATPTAVSAAASRTIDAHTQPNKPIPFALDSMKPNEYDIAQAAAAVEAASRGSNESKAQTTAFESTSNKTIEEYPFDPNGKTYSYKVLVVGNAKCGKTSIIARYAKNSFSEAYSTTIGADYARKVVNQADGNRVQLQLWDLAGQDRFAKLTRAYFRGAHAAVVVCDITRAETQHAVREWKREIDDQFDLHDEESRKRFPVILLMNKSDLLDKSIDELLRMGQELERLKTELGFTAAFTTSAKESRFVAEAFDNIIQALYQQERERQSVMDDVESLLESLENHGPASSSSKTEDASERGTGSRIVDLSKVALAATQASCCAGKVL